MATSRRDFGVSVGALAAHGFGFGEAASKPAIGTDPIEPEIRNTLQRTVLPNQKTHRADPGR